MSKWWLVFFKEAYIGSEYDSSFFCLIPLLFLPLPVLVSKLSLFYFFLVSHSLPPGATVSCDSLDVPPLHLIRLIEYPAPGPPQIASYPIASYNKNKLGSFRLWHTISSAAR